VTPEQNLEIQDCSTTIVEATAGESDTDGTYCVDVDECAARECTEDGVLYKANVTCSANASCWNSPGSYVCLCNEGLSGDDGTVCKNVDECSSPAPSTSDLSSMAWLCKVLGPAPPMISSHGPHTLSGVACTALKPFARSFWHNWPRSPLGVSGTDLCGNAARRIRYGQV